MATALRGNIHWHDFGPVTGAELSGNRPALILSSNSLNKSLTTAITVPTSTTEPQERFRRQHVWLNESESYASARQLKSVLQENLGERIGQASSQELEDIITSIIGRIWRNKTPANWNRRKHYAQYNAEQSCSTLAKRNEKRPPTTCSSSTTTQGTTWQ